MSTFLTCRLEPLLELLSPPKDLRFCGGIARPGVCWSIPPRPQNSSQLGSEQCSRIHLKIQQVKQDWPANPTWICQQNCIEIEHVTVRKIMDDMDPGPRLRQEFSHTNSVVTCQLCLASPSQIHYIFNRWCRRRFLGAAHKQKGPDSLRRPCGSHRQCDGSRRHDLPTTTRSRSPLPCPAPW